MTHEHQSPNRTLTLNETNIYREYTAAGWTRQEILFNVIDTNPTNDATEYDTASIQHYRFPPQHIDAPEPYATKGTPYNTKLSDLDIRWAAEAYPRKATINGLTPSKLQTVEGKPGESTTYQLKPDVAGPHVCACIGDGLKTMVLLENSRFIAAGYNYDTKTSLIAKQIDMSPKETYTVTINDLTGAISYVLFWQGQL